MKMLLDCAGLQTGDVLPSDFHQCFPRSGFDRFCISFLIRINLPKVLETAALIKDINPNAKMFYLDLSKVGSINSRDLLDDFVIKQGFEQVMPISRVIHAAALDEPLTEIRNESRSESPIVSKPTLVIVSPFLPEKTGVADYVAQLLPHLARYYDFFLVTDAPDEIRQQIIFPGELLSSDEFLSRTDLHQRVLYHIGNSHFHWHARALLKRVPGVVVLHDFFIGESSLGIPDDLSELDRFLPSLIRDHGFQALWKNADKPLASLARMYPACLDILQASKRVIVHSKHAKELARKFYSVSAEEKCTVVPHHELPRRRPPGSELATLRDKYGIEPDAFVVATFGFGGPSKCHEAIVFAWMNSRFVNDHRARLIFVGDYADHAYLERLKSLIDDLGGCSNISFTGYIDAEGFQDYLNIADLAVQLRSGTWGESSGTVLDCLAAEVPTVVTDIGSFSELPDAAVWKIAGDQALPTHLITAIEHLFQYPSLRTRLIENGLDYINSYCNPDNVAKSYSEVIESAARESRIYEKSLQLKTAERIKLARTLACNAPDLGMPRLWVDVTALAQLDLRTGVQRVTRSLLTEIMETPPKGYRVELVYLDSALQQYRYARKFSLELLGLNDSTVQDEVIFPMHGDCFFGLDLHPGGIARAEKIFDTWRMRGVRIVFLLHDMLPVRHPEWFPPSEFPYFSGWLNVITKHANGIIAVSKTSSEDISAWIAALPDKQRSPVPIEIAWFHNGGDIGASIPSRGLPDNAPELIRHIAKKPSFLMVATLEPRKGHAQVLEAFNLLWAQGQDINLVIVGKEGWMVGELVEQIRQHPMFGNNLIWLQGISDEYLDAIYPASSALIAASEGEGFGLPIIEAANHGTHVIARDIPVFREVGRDGADYFKATTGAELAEYIASWLAKPPGSRAAPENIRVSTWRDAARKVVPFVIGQPVEQLKEI